jgi:hypothetical protein
MVQNRIRVGTVIERTHRPFDLIPAFLRELRRVAGESAVATVINQCASSEGSSFASFMDNYADAVIHWNCSEDDAELAAYLESDECAWDVNALIDALSAEAPSYLYFGLHEGDGADYGYWPAWDSIQHDAVPVAKYDAGRGADLLAVSDLAEVPADYYGLVYMVNDHGNSSMYDARRYSASDAGHVFTLVWDCV